MAESLFLFVELPVLRDGTKEGTGSIKQLLQSVDCPIEENVLATPD